jgi:hypothetical protein
MKIIINNRRTINIVYLIISYKSAKYGCNSLSNKMSSKTKDEEDVVNTITMIVVYRIKLN